MGSGRLNTFTMPSTEPWHTSKPSGPALNAPSADLSVGMRLLSRGHLRERGFAGEPSHLSVPITVHAQAAIAAQTMVYARDTKPISGA